MKLNRCPLCRADIAPTSRTRTRQEKKVDSFVERAQVFYDTNDSNQLIDLIWEYRDVLHAAGEFKNAKEILDDMNIADVSVTRWIAFMEW